MTTYTLVAHINRKNRVKGSIVGYFQLSEHDADLASIKWTKHCANKPYLKHREQGFLHRVVAKRIWGYIPQGWEVDHIDGDHTNNIRTNLRLCTKYGQMLNQRKSGQSVRKNKSGSWTARYGFKHSVHLGSFKEENVARKAAQAFHSELVARAHDDGHYTYPGNTVPPVPPAYLPKAA